MRWHILRTLLHKEILRNLANRGGIALALLLVVSAMLLSFFERGSGVGGPLLGGVQRCYLDYWDQDGVDPGWIEHLRRHPPADLAERVRFRTQRQFDVDDTGRILYPENAGAIQIRVSKSDSDGKPLEYFIWFWQPSGAAANGLAPFDSWFWEESRRYFQMRLVQQLKRADMGSVPELDPASATEADLTIWRDAHRYFQSRVADLLQELDPNQRQAIQPIPDMEFARSQLQGPWANMHAAVSTVLVIFALFFACVYTLPSLTCEERERGVLLAQALSPASPLEILFAKFLFYPALGIGLGTILAGIYSLALLRQPFFWVALTVSAAGALGVGMTIASLARTQREASMGALCYLLSVTLILFICQQNQLVVVQFLFLEYHTPRILRAAFAHRVTSEYVRNLIGAFVLTLLWLTVATYLFRKRGWQ
ncbi:MAG: ABC transporter permease [Gemmataceae bacterium]